MKHKLFHKFKPDTLKILKYSREILSVIVLVLAVFVLLGIVHPLSIMGTVAPSSYNKLGTWNCNEGVTGSIYPCSLSAAQAVSAPYQNIGSNVTISGNTSIQDSGGLNNGLTVNGRIQTGDSQGLGGMWVDDNSKLFVGAADKGDTEIGFWTGTSFPFYATGNQICLNKNCVSSWPAIVTQSGYMSRLLTINSPTQCNNYTYTLTLAEMFPNQIDAGTPVSAAAGSNPTNSNVTIGPTNNSTTQQVVVWNGVGNCWTNNTAATFYIMVFGH